MRISLVEPGPSGPNVYSFTRLPRLGLPLIGTLLARAGHDVAVYCEVLSAVDLGQCLAADLVGISATTSTAPAAYRLADLLERAGTPVVMGGPHVTFCPDEALAHARFVVRGEGHATMCELVDALERGRDLSSLGGLSYLDAAGEPHHNPARPRTSQADFDGLPFPDLELVAGHDRLVTTPLMTQWGCPFDCEFCSVTAMFSRAVRARSAAHVVAELQHLQPEKLFFYDDNFVSNKARTTVLLQDMVRAGTTPPWYAQVRADVVLRSPASAEVDHGFLQLMHRAGAQMVMIGFETATDAGLAAIGKRLTVAVQEKAVHALHEHGIAVHGMFVAGLDTDTSSSAGETARFARRVGIDTFQLMAETPLPGSKLWSRAHDEGRVLCSDWSLYDGHQVVMQPAHMSALELQLGILEASRKFYSRGSVLRPALAAAVSHLPSLTWSQGPELLAQLPALVKLAFARRWQDIAPHMQGKLPTASWARLEDTFWLPAIRLYARRQLRNWSSSERSRRHIELLRALTASAG